MACTECAAEREAGSEFCRHCFEIFRRPGRLRRWLEALGLLERGRPRDTFCVHRSISEILEVQDEATGETRRYTDLATVPPEVRAAISRIRARPGGSEGSPSVSSEFHVVDGSGNERVYRTLDEVPPELRALFEGHLPPSRRR